MKVFLSLVLLSICLCAVAIADEPPEVDWNLAHPKAKAAIKEYEATTKKLNEQYKARRKKDLDTLHEALTKVMKEQAQATDIDGAGKTKAALTAIAGGAGPPVADAVEAVDNEKPPAKAVYLDDLAETSASVGYGVVGKQGALGIDANMVFIRGKRLQHALATHPPTNGSAQIAYAINGAYRVFKGAVALNDGSPNGTPVTFKVLGDDKVLWKSSQVSLPGAIQNFNVKLAGVKVLTLQVDCPGDYAYRRAVWIEPQLK